MQLVNCKDKFLLVCCRLTFDTESKSKAKSGRCGCTCGKICGSHILQKSAKGFKSLHVFGRVPLLDSPYINLHTCTPARWIISTHVPTSRTTQTNETITVPNLMNLSLEQISQSSSSTFTDPTLILKQT